MIIKDNISPDEAQLINRRLAGLSANEIPKDEIERCLEYLAAVLLADQIIPCIDPQIRPQLERLENELLSLVS